MNLLQVITVSPWLSLLPYVLLTGTLIGLLTMYLALKREIGNQAQRHRRVEAMLIRLKEASSMPAAQASGNVKDPEAVLACEVSQFVTLRPGMNLSRRTQALRLLRRGEDHSHIASALGVPRCEIDLLAKVHRLSMAAAAGQGASGIDTSSVPEQT